MSPGAAIIDGEQQLTFSGQSRLPTSPVSRPVVWTRGRMWTELQGGTVPRPWSHQPLVLPTLASVVGLRPESYRSELPFPQDFPPTLGSTLRQKRGWGSSDLSALRLLPSLHLCGCLCYMRNQ